MPDQIVSIPGVGNVAFPESMNEQEITSAADRLYRESQPSKQPNSGLSPAIVAAADVVRRGVERAGLQVATSPNLRRAVNAASRPAAAATARAIGATHGLPGYVAGEALTNPATLRAAETGIRAGSGFLARLVASPLARAVTGLPGLLGSMPFSEAGDRPLGETPDRTTARQGMFARQYADQVNRSLGYEAIKGNTTDELLKSIAVYKGSK